MSIKVLIADDDEGMRLVLKKPWRGPVVSLSQAKRRTAAPLSAF